jgi:hypothetical protein
LGDLSQGLSGQWFIIIFLKHIKNSQKTVKKLSKNTTKIYKNPPKNPQKKQKINLFRKNIKINVDIDMRKGGIHSLGELSNTISFLNVIGKV